MLKIYLKFKCFSFHPKRDGTDGEEVSIFMKNRNAERQTQTRLGEKWHRPKEERALLEQRDKARQTLGIRGRKLGKDRGTVGTQVSGGQRGHETGKEKMGETEIKEK